MRARRRLGESSTFRGADEPFHPFNRKYLGSKRLLATWIVERICESRGVPETFLDGFCGTGAVALEMARRGAPRVTAVDSLHSNCVILRGFCRNPMDEPGRGRLACLVDRLNGLPPSRGYIFESFSGTYFTPENCERMDSIREEIARLAARGEISEGEHDILLASFLLAADRVANTLGQYDAFLKNIGGESVVDGRHLLDERVRTPFRLRMLKPTGGAAIEVLEGDMLDLAPSTACSVAYFDPPYNARQYCDNYHVLENMARWEKPQLFGKTRKFDRSGLRSPFCRRSQAAAALDRLIVSTRAACVFLSYGSEGILSREQIIEILGRRGKVRVFELPYPVFGNGAGVSAKRTVTEYLFLLEMGG